MGDVPAVRNTVSMASNVALNLAMEPAMNLLSPLAQNVSSEADADDLQCLKPARGTGPRRTALDVLEHLRGCLLSGALKPGTVLSQVDVARRLDVSRTPVREALRMLQQEGLVEGEPNFRCRVVGFTPELIDAAYGERILIETLAAQVTTRAALPDDDVIVMRRIDEMNSTAAHADFNVWQVSHKAFHAIFMSRAPTPLQQTLEDRIARTQRYRTLLKSRYPDGWWRRGEVEHKAIADLFIARDVEGTVRALGRHLARSALEILTDIAPEYDPVCVRASLALITPTPNSTARKP